MKTCAVVLAAGSGTRMKSTIPKQFIEVHGKPILVYTLERLSESDKVDGIIIVGDVKYMPYITALVEQYHIPKVMDIVEGGKTGIESTYNGIKAVTDDYDSVIVQDGNRPVIDDEIIDHMVQVYEMHGNAVSAIPAVELIYKSQDGISSQDYVERRLIWKSHTPQMYDLKRLKRLYDAASKEDYFTGYLSTTEILTKHGHPIYFSEGKTSNIKITYREDLKVLEALLR